MAPETNDDVELTDAERDYLLDPDLVRRVVGG